MKARQKYVIEVRDPGLLDDKWHRLIRFFDPKKRPRTWPSRAAAELEARAGTPTKWDEWRVVPL